MVALSTSLFLAVSLAGGGGYLLPDNLTAAILWLAGCIAVAGVVDAVRMLKWTVPDDIRGKRIIGLWVGFVFALGLWAFVLYLASVPGGRSKAIRLAWPVTGEWRVVAGGRTALTNYHHGNPAAQDYAVDMVLSGPEGASKGEPVYAPVSGTVTKAVGSRSAGDEEAEGNVVCIRTEGGVEVLMAHLGQGSVRVHAGERVVAGERIGSCGDTGNADIAHLHIHAESGGMPVAMLFSSEGRFLMRNERVTGGAR